MISGGRSACETGSRPNWKKVLNASSGSEAARVCFEWVDLAAASARARYSPFCAQGTVRCWGDWLKDLRWASLPSPWDSWDPSHVCRGSCAAVQRPGPRPRSSLLRPVWSVRSLRRELLKGQRRSNRKATNLKEQEGVAVLEAIQDVTVHLVR